MNELLQKLLLLRTPGIGPASYLRLLEKYGSVAEAVESLGLTNDFIDSVKREMDAAEKMGIKYLMDTDSFYPRGLLTIKNHPPVISVRGNVDSLIKPVVAMVGTRHATSAGMGFMAELACAFVKHGFVVASGMAMGTDTAAHMGALRADGNAQTVAVLAGGVDYIWPLENESLYFNIIERGAIISEMPVGFIPKATNFVQRNRLVAGMSDIAVIGEADMKSGSMTTARFALEYNKKLFAIPGHPSDARSMGPNSLIKSGAAVMCMSGTDFFDDEKKQKSKKNHSAQNDLLDKLGMIPVSESVLANLVKKSVSEIRADLTILELQGLIRKQDAGYVLN